MVIEKTFCQTVCRLAALFLFLQLAGSQRLRAQDNDRWRGAERQLHYRPDGDDFLLVKGERRFNRALYGGNTAFRVEAGDLPEFALYLPGMGGNLKFGLVNGDSSKWLIRADSIQTRYRPGAMLYKVRDALLGRGELLLTVLALHNSEGAIVKIEGRNLPSGVKLLAAYGGATGKKFSRDGDLGADPESSFNLNPAYCSGNSYRLRQNRFTLYYGGQKPPKAGDSTGLAVSNNVLSGVFPPAAHLVQVDAARQASPLALYRSGASATPAVAGLFLPGKSAVYLLLRKGPAQAEDAGPAEVFNRAEAARKQLAHHIKLVTPDPFINVLGGALSVAADAIWEDPSFLHGAVAWRMRLNGWRGAYAGDVLGWHNRARKHFNGYALSQLTTPPAGPVVMDTALHLARGLEKLGTAVYSSGYISRNPGGDKRPHHYDMNLGFIDQLLNHFSWTGDTAYVRQMWPLLVRHLDWEKRNFDRDGDGLYDAYAAIWASDALQYSGGGVAHSSAYNYRANKTAAELAALIGEDGSKYKAEAEKIYSAIHQQLWLPRRGWMAEFKDLLGERAVHPYAGLWTIYHALDAGVPDAFEAWQMLRYVDTEIPHLPIRAKGLTDTTLYTLSTTSWQPYTWSLNNVALAEVQHTALAYWQGGRSEEAFRLWKSSLVESVYLGASPGNFHQLSFYDARRGELYRDFADAIGAVSRSLVAGLFGINPQLLQKRLLVQPGFPATWNRASLTTPDLVYTFSRRGNTESYVIKPSFAFPVKLSLRVKAFRDAVAAVWVNGKKAAWQWDSAAVGAPAIRIEAPAEAGFRVTIHWKGASLEKPAVRQAYKAGEAIRLTLRNVAFVRLRDPQGAVKEGRVQPHHLEVIVAAGEGARTFFLQVKQGGAVYWLPVSFLLAKPAAAATLAITPATQYRKVNLQPYFNDDVKNIFKNQYLSPRPQTTTLQLPTQGIGNWAYPLVTASIDDSGLRRRAGEKNEVVVQGGIPFFTPSDPGAKNIVFTSQWDAYPTSVTLPLNGRASGACLLLAGSTNAMQSRLTNGEVVVTYSDGSSDTLVLRNPENWWPIEQDFYEDGFAFATGAPRPLRLYLKSGEDAKSFYPYSSIKGFTERAVDGGAATVLTLPLDPAKNLQSVTLRARANDVVIGLMALTLIQ